MKKFYLKLVFLTLFTSSSAFAQIYVTETGAGNKDGTSWTNAYDNTQLQQAINEAESATIKQVWVAKGTYRPTEILANDIYSTTTTSTRVRSDATDRDKAFILKTGVAIYGGFAGTETTINDRIFSDVFASPFTASSNETILSGDLNNNSLADEGDAYHVVAARDHANGAILDGFTITDGYGNGTDHGFYAQTPDGTYYRRNIGAALAIISTSTLTFKNLLIKDNQTSNAGGGIRASAVDDNTKLYFENVRFENNKTGSYGGGAVYSIGGTINSSVNFTRCNFVDNEGAGSTGGGAIFHDTYTLNITDCNFENNVSTSYGGGLRLNSGTGNIVSTVFKGGSASTRGGGIYSTNVAVLNLDGCTFDNNTSTSGGHYYLYSGTTNITNTTFQNGNSTGSGGALFNFFGTLTISKNKFYSNTSADGAAAVHASSNTTTEFSSTSIYNSIFFNNTTNGTGNTAAGAVYTSVNSNSTIINSTFFQNKSASAHGAISFNNAANTTVKMYNNIFSGNISAYNTTSVSTDIREGNSATMDFRNNLFQTFSQISSGNDTFSGNVLNDAPASLFASTTETDYNFLWPVQGGFSLDKGDNSLYTNNINDINTATDLLGNARLVNGTARLEGAFIDLGAIEWGVVLPVTIKSFTANLANNRTQLKWSVGTADNVNRYEVERSQNGTDFDKVAEVLANGSSSYTTVDANPQLGVNYYRLKTIDNDGTHSYYGAIQSVKVTTLSTEGIKVYPNPVRDGKVNISLIGYPTGTYTYKLLSTSGLVVQQGQLNYDGSSAKIDFSRVISGGMYLLQLNNGEHSIQTKLIKQ